MCEYVKITTVSASAPICSYGWRLSALYPMTLYSRKNIFAHYLLMYSFYHQDLCKPTKLLETDRFFTTSIYYSVVTGNKGRGKKWKQECIKDCSFIFINVKARVTALQSIKKPKQNPNKTLTLQTNNTALLPSPPIYHPALSNNAFYFSVDNLRGSLTFKRCVFWGGASAKD